MSRSDEPTRDDTAREQAADWLAASTFRLALATFGFVIVLLALGEAVGFDLLGAVVDVFESSVGRWLIVAFVGLVLIGFAVRGFEGGVE